MEIVTGAFSGMMLTSLGWYYYLCPGFLRDAWACVLGFVLWIFHPRKKIIETNLGYAYPDSPWKRRELYRESYRHLAQLILEIIMLFGPMRRFVSRETEVEGIEHWKTAHAQGKGVIFLSSHVGCWEIMAATGGVRYGIDLMLVTKRLKPAWLHAAIERARSRCGVKGTYEPKTMRDVLAHLKSGGTVGFVQDQYAGPPVGVRVPVFGIPVGTMSVAATLACRTGIPVLPVVNYRMKGGRYRIEIEPPIVWKTAVPESEIAENTAAYAAALEKHIYAHPEQWLWSHRRFKGDLSPIREGEWASGRVRK